MVACAIIKTVTLKSLMLIIINGRNNIISYVSRETLFK